METRKQVKSRFQIEKLEERIAPCTMTLEAPANSTAVSNVPSSVPANSAATAANTSSAVDFTKC